jgi:hypothetical protein
MPYFISKVEREDTSDHLNQKETISFSIKKEKGREHTIKLDIPKFKSDGTTIINGVKNIIHKQIVALPIIKIRPDEVLVTTAYNKVVVSRYGQNTTPASTEFRTILKRRLKDNDLPKEYKFKLGKAIIDNRPNAVEYNDIGSEIVYIEGRNILFCFSRDKLDKFLVDLTWLIMK